MAVEKNASPSWKPSNTSQFISSHGSPLHSSDQSQLPELPTPYEGHWRKPHKVNTIPTTLQLCHQKQAKKTNAKVDGLSRQT